jgi:putative NADH-flavin reductase
VAYVPLLAATKLQAIDPRRLHVSIALIGASGAVGSRILKELSDRGHAVIAIARHPENIAALPNVTARRGDVFDETGLVELLQGHDMVVSSVHFTASDPRILIDAVKAAGVKRYVVVGGAGSLEVKPGVRLIDTPEFPDAYKAEAGGGAAFLDLLRQEPDLDWTFLSPSLQFVPGERTGEFRLGKDALLSTDKGSIISFEDYAVALVDEIENPAHSRQRFTVGY